MDSVNNPAYGALRALDPATGERKWEFRYLTPSTAGLLTTASGLVFTGDADGNVIALDSRSGTLLWSYQMGAKLHGTSATTYMVERAAARPRSGRGHTHGMGAALRAALEREHQRHRDTGADERRQKSPRSAQPTALYAAKPKVMRYRACRAALQRQLAAFQQKDRPRDQDMTRAIASSLWILYLTRFSATAQLQLRFDVELNTVPVAGNVHLIQRPDGFANVGVFVGEEGVLLVDSQFEPHAEDLVAAVGKLTDGEIRFLINTHVHPDHIGGNAPLAVGGVLIFAHDNMRVRIAREPALFPAGQRRLRSASASRSAPLCHL